MSENYFHFFIQKNGLKKISSRPNCIFLFDYTNIVTGFSMNALNVFKNAAPDAPSTTR